MVELGQIADKVRSKNAGPFWLTIDVFCGDAARFEHIAAYLDNVQVAGLLAAKPETLKRFELPDLHVIKFSVPRPTVQGSLRDRDMHGAQWANLLAELRIQLHPAD